MREQRFGPKKAGTSSFSNPSLVSPHTPTLANPVRSFGLSTNNFIQTQTAESTNQQQAQSAGEDSLLSPTIEQRSFGHDISRIAVCRPQAKLTVGEPGDKYEQEADWMANQVMRMVVPDKLNTPRVQPVPDSLHRKCAACEEEDKVQTKPFIQPFTNGGLQSRDNIESRLNSSKGGGSPLPDDVRSFMEPRFGVDFSSVRVHTGSDAVQMNRDLSAQAFTHRSDVYFGEGKAPGNNELTAHELTHVVQQTGGVQAKQVSQQSRINITEAISGMVQGSWIGDRINWVRTATREDNWIKSDPPGAYYILNGLSMEDMVKILRALTSQERKKLSDNLDQEGAGCDRPRIHLGLSNAQKGSGDRWWQDLSEKVHWAIRSNQFVEYPNGAFWIINPLNENDTSKIMKFLNRDSLDELIANGESAIKAGVPNAQRILRDANKARGTIGSTKREQHLIDLIDGKDWKTFFTEFNGMSEADKLRFLRGYSGATAQISNNIDKASGISDQDYLRYLVEKATRDASTSLYVDAMVKNYRWQPKYRVNDPKEYSRIIRFGNNFNIEIDINTIDNGQMSDEEAEQQFREAKPGPGGFLWPTVRNRSTLPMLWKVKQDIHKQMETLLFDEVLAAGIEVVIYLLTVVLPEAQSGAMQSLKALERGSLSTRWMKGSQVLKGQKPQIISDAEAFTKARDARNQMVRDYDKMSKAQREQISTVTGGVNVETGQVTAGYAQGGKCAEDVVVEKLGGDPSKVKFSEALRPRTKQQVPVCQRCQGKYTKDQFAEGAIFDGPGVEMPKKGQ